ncbi:MULTISPECIES: hypothetical protein [unclassified Gordonia (in: high G+C Gram-positive bacteria)]|uniref:LppU/SCO3897 family protein n=1 Tax=unclassified Gordonia (in: high G+C Gram-positive bacteria) TaxID=2657482 RepID=UPI001F058164|nr:hypothetical protein [Gordonia sp. PDNC005]
MTTPPPGQPGQPAPGNPFGAQGQPVPQQPGQPVYGQQPPQPAQPYGAQPGQPQPGQQPYGAQPGQPQQGQPGGYAPVAGGTDYAAGAPQAPRPNPLLRILKFVGPIIAVIAIIAIATQVFGDKDSGTSVESSPVGSCLTVEGTTSVTTKAIDCSTTDPSFIVGAKLDNSDACESANYEFSVTEYGNGASDKVLCLIPNYQVGTCYTQSSFSIGIELKTVACSEESTMSTTNFKITERSETGSVPNCTDSDTQRSDTFNIQADPARQMTICREILGDYTWK